MNKLLALKRETTVPNEKTLELDLASRWSRLWAALIDAGLAIAITLPLMSYLGVWKAASQGTYHSM